MSLLHGVLGLLHYSPMSGYDLKKIFEESVHFFWSAQTSQIYRELQALEKAGCVESWIEPGTAGPNRRIYRITARGIERLREWLLDVPNETGEDNRNEFLLRVFLSSNVGGDELLRQLRRRLDKYRSDLQKLREVQAGIAKYGDKFDIKKETPFWRISLSRGFHDVESHIRWAKESIRHLEEQGFEADRTSLPPGRDAGPKKARRGPAKRKPGPKKRP
jgi:PadR family transcriptional regulator, regulatory protein AphA